jgi:hypothetical protein
MAQAERGENQSILVCTLLGVLGTTTIQLVPSIFGRENVHDRMNEIC